MDMVKKHGYADETGGLFYKTYKTKYHAHVLSTNRMWGLLYSRSSTTANLC